MTGYELSRAWFDWSFENPDLNSPTHTALFMWCIEKWNRLGQKDKLSLPSSEAMEAIGVKSYNTYKRVFDNLVEWGFVNLVTASKNQHTCNVIALSNFDKAHNKALDKALTKHTTKQSESTQQSNCSINKQRNKETKKPITTGEPEISNDGVPEFVKAEREQIRQAGREINPNIQPASELGGQLKADIATCELFCMNYKLTMPRLTDAIGEFVTHITLLGEDYTRTRFRSHFTNWLPKHLEKAGEQSLTPKKQMVY